MVSGNGWVTGPAAARGSGHLPGDQAQPKAALADVLGATGTSGQRFPFLAGTAGKLTYLYFGYAHCPDACPITMATLAAAIREQSPAIRRRIAIVFVTVDPARDTAPALAAWLNNFYPGIIGLTGTMPQIQVAEKAAGVAMATVEHDPGTDYLVRHSAVVIAYSPDGLAHTVYAEGTKPETFSHDMPLLLRY